MKILIADDHFAVREGLKAILRGPVSPAVEIVGETSSIEETRLFLGRSIVDLVLLDINFADGNGLDLVADWAGKPGAPRFLILSMYQEGTFVLKALQAGAGGYVGKDSAGEVLLAALAVVEAGGTYLDGTSLNALATRLRTIPPEATEADHCLAVLTAREKEIFYGLLRGQSTKALAQELAVSPKTVENHRSMVYAKLHLEGYPDLVKFGQENNLF
jgi:DNA-binding NarL/FixJ family response regulator